MDGLTMKLRECESGYFFPGSSRREATLLCCREGSLCCVAQGQPFFLAPGEFLLLAPDSWYMLFAESDSAPVFLELTFPAEQGSFAPIRGRDPLAAALMEEATEQKAHWQEMCGHLLGQLLILLQRRESFLPAAEAGEFAILCRVQRIISAHVREKLSVPAVAKKAGISASYLTALFRKHLPFSPGAYLRRAKLEESRAMIREGMLSFTQISQMLEYSTVHQFSRQFKEVFGITPSEYARSNRP